MLDSKRKIMSHATTSPAIDLAMAVLDRQSLGSVLLNERQQVCFWGAWLSQWTGISVEQAEGKTLSNLFPALFETDFIVALDAAIIDQRETEWSQQLDPERLDRVEAILTSGRREMPLHSVVFLPISLSEYGRCCLVQISEAPFDPIVVKNRLSAKVPSVDIDGGELPVYLKSDQSPIFSVDKDGLIQSVNEVACRLFGYSEEYLRGKPARMVFPELDSQSMDDVLGDFSQTDNQMGEVIEGVTLNGETLSLRAQTFRSASGDGGMAIICRDVTRFTVNREALFQQRELLSVVCEQVADGILLLDRHGFIEHINPVGRELLGVSDRAAGNMHIDELMVLVNEAGESLPLPPNQTLDRGSAVSAPENTLLRIAGAEPLPVMLTATPIRNRLNQITGCTVVFRAVSEARRVSSKLSWQSRHDPLTQLANRRHLESEIVRAIDQAHADQTCHTLLYIDLYNFSIVNDTCGHNAGDELLRRFARMLEKQVSPKDVVARIGNDEFAVLINDRSIEESRQMAEELIWEVKSFSFPWDERRLKIGASIGAKVIDQDTTSEIDVLLAAGESCSIAKELGRNRIHFNYRSKEVLRRQSVANWIPKITDALDEDRFVLYSQPIVPVKKTGQVKHSEILVRMVDREGNIILPGEFIPAAERYGLIEDIDRWVFDKVLEHVVEIQQAGDTESRFAINLSGNTVSDESMKDYIINRFCETGVDPRRLQFEITETAAIRHFDRAMNFINALKAEGCSFALDDFGSGLSSLGYLKQLPVDYLKIDGSFIRAMELNEVDYSMVSTINHLGQIMGIKTIAECVETDTQLAMLEEIGVDYIQGYIIAKPAPLVRP